MVNTQRLDLARDTDRRDRLMPGGTPRYVRIYHDDTPDGTGHYCAVFSGRHSYGRTIDGRFIRAYPFREMDRDPFHPQGVGLWGDDPRQPIDTYPKTGRGYAWPPAIGRRCHLGRRIRFADLPEACQRSVLADYRELWSI